MRIAYISSGAAGMYCGTCIHDNTLAAALMRQGHEVALVPTYTPTRTDESNVSVHRVFLGGINIYLQQKSAFFAHLPSFVRRLLDNGTLLNLLSRFSARTSGEELGALTLAMVQGERGSLHEEIDDLAAWLRDDFKPEVIELNISLYLGLARRLRNELRVPIVCAVQGEDFFLDQLIEPYRSQVRDELRQRAGDVDTYIATSRYYARHMSAYLEVPESRFQVVPLGINLQGHGRQQSSRHPDSPFTIGYLARICPEKGLDILAQAFRILAERHDRDRVRLKVAGWLGKKDRAFFEKIRSDLARWGLAGSWEYAGEVNRADKIDFLNSIDVLSVPTIYKEPKGLFVLEALANEVPVVVPDHGSFPEMIEATRGGILVEPGSPSAVAAAIEELIGDDQRRRQLGEAGRRAVVERFGDALMARETAEVYRSILKGQT